MKNSFHALGLPQSILHALEKMKFSTPTPIQAQAIPVAIEGRDILGSAQTGTGKTAAFAIPLLVHLLNKPRSMAVVLTPTRELAVQVMQMIRELQDRSSPIASALLIGGDSMQKQLKQLQRKPRIIVGTPGRINDHLKRRSLRLQDADFLVLDETDRMLDMGFGVQVEQIMGFMKERRQTLMFSATIPAYIGKMSDKYLDRPERIAVGSTTKPLENIKQELVRTTVVDKYTTLVTELTQRTGSIIVFVRTRRGADKMARKLNREHHNVEAIHGDLKQSRRDRVIQAFRQKKCRVLIATDVAARGLDIPHIEHVINYDLPQCPEDYIHRIGRTARAGATGTAVCIITSEDGGKWNAIQRLINPEAKQSSPDNKKRKDRNKNRRKSKRSKSNDNNSYGRNGEKPVVKSRNSKSGKPKSFRFKRHSKRVKSQSQAGVGSA